MLRHLSLTPLLAVLAVAAGPAASRAAAPAPAAGSARAVRAVIDRVELAAVADDSGACAVMGTAVQQAYIRGADVTAGVRSPVESCAAAVRDDHAGYLRDHELGAERTAQDAVVRAFAAGSVSFTAHGRSAVAVAHLTTRQFLGRVHSTVTVTLGHRAAGWEVLRVTQRPSGSTAPPPPII